ncbi:putative methyltransferase PMT9 [Drosera capensis]
MKTCCCARAGWRPYPMDMGRATLRGECLKNFTWDRSSIKQYVIQSSLSLSVPPFSLTRCESFSTYPRTFDLLHAWMVFSEILERGCSAGDLLIEIDRILRPEGFVIIRDKPPIIKYLQESLNALRWDGWSTVVDPRIDSLSTSEERALLFNLGFGKYVDLTLEGMIGPDSI